MAISTACDGGTRVIAPSKKVQRFISHYWLSLANTDPIYVALPDGAVDLVMEVGGTPRTWIYGTTTGRTEIPLTPRTHYLGVRFKPGQSRHLIKAAASELTDSRAPADGLLPFSVDRALEHIEDENVGDLLDQLLASQLGSLEIAHSRIDEAIEAIEASHGRQRITEVAECFGKSQRQFERTFLSVVGVSAKMFSSIARFRRAAELLALNVSLAGAAAEAGYVDQSHMSNEFKRMAGVSPGAFACSRVEFLQDGRISL